MSPKKPCDECVVLANCTHVCDNFLQWCVVTKQVDLKCHPHYDIALISTDQISWINEQMKTYRGERIGFLFPD